MSKVTAAVVLGAALAGGLALAANVDKAALAKKQDVLTAEYGLAKGANFYFVFDVRGRKVELRARGMALKTWPIREMRFWGRTEFGGTVELISKTAIRAPERIVIKPGDAEPALKTPTPKPGTSVLSATAADYDLEAIELRDMPGRFSLDLDNGLHISVKAGTGRKPDLGTRLKETWRWYVALPLRDLIGNKGPRQLADLELTFEKEEDAQSIYWHFFDGIKGIIL